jgi:cytochrome c oxidase subunit IV
MSNLSYEDQKKSVFNGLLFLGGVTIAEVGFALLAKGHWISGIDFAHTSAIGQGLYMLVMVGASLIKAYFIIFYFMHMAYEVRGLALSVLLPTALLIWAIIAFFQEGSSWGARREQIKEKNEAPAKEQKAMPQGYLVPGLVKPVQLI